MGKALYRKYRSRSLDEIVGQEHVTAILRRAIERGRVAHAYLFTGPRGVGKTSIARILAHEINGLPYQDDSTNLDIIEIDAASNNGVDDIRDLREKVTLAPAAASKKIYIIDEVHMLSKAAFNALLKTLEEPPEHVVFILATTDVDKLPETIISRTQRHTFRRASTENIIKNLTKIAKEEKIKIDGAALELIADHSDGSYRDSVSLLDQLANSTSSDETITSEVIEASLGLASKKAIETLLDHLSKKAFESSLADIKQLEENGIQASVVARQMIREIQRFYPELLELVDGLIDVTSSPMPYASLMAHLGTYCDTPKPPKTVAAAVSAPPIPELAELAEEEHPKDPEPIAPKARTPEVTEVIEAPKEPTKKRAKKSSPPTELDWQALLDHLKTESIALYSVLSKCAYDVNDSELTLYTKNEFYKKKLSNSRYQQQLQTSLQETTSSEWEIVLIPGAKPPSDSRAAAIAAMMGGGEEVSLEE